MFDRERNPFASPATVRESPRPSNHHPARWLLLTGGCLLSVPLMGLVAMAFYSIAPPIRTIPFLILDIGLALLSFWMGLSKYTATSRVLSIFYGTFLGIVVPGGILIMIGVGDYVLFVAGLSCLFFSAILVSSILHKPASIDR